MILLRLLFLEIMSACLFFYSFGFTQTLPSFPDELGTTLGGEGDSKENAVVIYVDGLGRCDLQDCFIDGFKAVTAEEYRYIESRFGMQGVDWKLVGEDNYRADIVEKSKFYDKVAIELLPSGEKKVIYFDISMPVLIMREGG